MLRQILNLEKDSFKVSEGDINIGISVKKGNTELKEKVDAVIATMDHDTQLEMMTNELNQQPLSDGSDAEALTAEETRDVTNE